MVRIHLADLQERPEPVAVRAQGLGGVLLGEGLLLLSLLRDFLPCSAKALVEPHDLCIRTVEIIIFVLVADVHLLDEVDDLIPDAINVPQEAGD